MSVLPCVNKKTWTLAPSRSTWKTSRLFFSRGKTRWPAIFSKNFRYSIQRNYSRPLPDNKPKNRAFSSTLLSVVVGEDGEDAAPCPSLRLRHGCDSRLLDHSPLRVSSTELDAHSRTCYLNDFPLTVFNSRRTWAFQIRMQYMDNLYYDFNKGWVDIWREFLSVNLGAISVKTIVFGVSINTAKLKLSYFLNNTLKSIRYLFM